MLCRNLRWQVVTQWLASSLIEVWGSLGCFQQSVVLFIQASEWNQTWYSKVNRDVKYAASDHTATKSWSWGLNSCSSLIPLYGVPSTIEMRDSSPQSQWSAQRKKRSKNRNLSKFKNLEKSESTVRETQMQENTSGYRDTDYITLVSGHHT